MRILSVDLGDVRTGLALSDQTEMLASPLCVITEYNKDKLLIRSAEIEDELVFGGFAFRERENGNMGLIWKE